MTTIELATIINNNQSNGLFAQTANSTIITNTNVEISLINGGVGSLSVPANFFKVGDSFRVVMAGIVNANNNQNITIRVKAGSIILLDSNLQNLGSHFIIQKLIMLVFKDLDLIVLIIQHLIQPFLMH